MVVPWKAREQTSAQNGCFSFYICFCKGFFFPGKQTTKIASCVFIYKSFSGGNLIITRLPIGLQLISQCKYFLAPRGKKPASRPGTLHSFAFCLHPRVSSYLEQPLRAKRNAGCVRRTLASPHSAVSDKITGRWHQSDSPCLVLGSKGKTEMLTMALLQSNVQIS